MSLYYILSLLQWTDKVALPAYMHANAVAGSAVLNCLGQQTQVEGVSIRSSQFTVNIKRGCDALEPAWLLAACIIAFPSTVISKVWGVCAGVLLIQVLNVVRISSLFLVGPRWPRLFETLHLEIWPVIFILSALGLWLCWLRLVRRKAHAHAT
jgi:exosortase H (IPTLxxWG-CTERM-specific)